MKEFKEKDKVTYNLMSFTAFKSLLLFSYLVEQPRSYEELKDLFAQHKYLKETISIDTLRVYINSLERLGCEIVRGRKCEGSKYKLLKHPFELQVSPEHANSIIKIFKSLTKTIDVEDLLSLTKFLKKISKNIENTELRETLENISPLVKIDNGILISLIKANRNKEQLIITYKSPNSGVKDIDVLVQNLQVKNNKVYLFGKSSKYKNTASFLVKNILKVTPFQKPVEQFDTPVIIGCELYDKSIKLADNERLISEDNEKMVIEIESINNFLAKQRILSLGSTCKVLYPESFKDEVINVLKTMRDIYDREKV